MAGRLGIVETLEIPLVGVKGLSVAVEDAILLRIEDHGRSRGRWRHTRYEPNQFLVVSIYDRKLSHRTCVETVAPLPRLALQQGNVAGSVDRLLGAARRHHQPDLGCPWAVDDNTFLYQPAIGGNLHFNSVGARC